ncbi:hypothetical protein, partial [Algoriphagus sp.]|uniref:hypothetical protein n=1 Tax=Algoriphagus sp. TaxID=1872435 RepID=UPI0032996ED4
MENNFSSSRELEHISSNRYLKIFEIKYLLIFTVVVYVVTHAYFYSFSEWLNTDYEKQIYSIANGGKWFFLDGFFTSRVPPLLPILFGLTLKLSTVSGISILLLSKLIILSCIAINAYLLVKISTEFTTDRFRFFPAFFYLLNPIIVYYSFKPLSEHLFMVFFLLFLWKFIQFLKREDFKYLTFSLFYFS